MKKIIAGLFALALIHGAHAQWVGTEAFMKGDYVEVGINGLGGFEGADWNITSPPVAGMHVRSGGANIFGFTANPQMDGWMNFDGDFYTPGCPENGWGFEIIDSSGAVNIQGGNNRYPIWDIPGAITSYTHTGGLHTVVWQGSYIGLGYDVAFTIEYNLFDNALGYTTTVTVSNNGPDIDEFYYYRTMDPDNNEPISFDFHTTNTIVAQPVPGGPYLASVKAESTTPWYSMVEFSANDSTARVSHGGFSNRDASDIWNALPGLTPDFATITSSGTYFGDNAISIAFKMDSLMSFRSARTFSFYTKFAPGITLGMEQNNINETGVYPNPTTGMLNIQSQEPVIAVCVYSTLGKLQMQAENVSSVDLSSLDAGIYLVTIETKAGKVTRRIVKE